MNLTINGKSVAVDDSFKDLSPEEQQAQVEEIAGHIEAGHKSHETVNQAPPADESSGLENLGGVIGGVVGTGVGGAALAGNKILDVVGPPSLQRYANTQIGDRYNVPLSELEKEVGFKLQTMPEVQKAVRKVAGSEATPEIIKPVYGVDKAGQPIITHYEKIPGAPAAEGIDLSKYKKGPLHGAKKVASTVGTGALAGYDIGRGLTDPTSIGGAADIAAGTAAAVAPWLPQKIGKIPVRAIATGLGLIPAAKGVVEAVMPEKAEGGLIHLASGGAVQEEPSDQYYSWAQQQISKNAPVLSYSEWRSKLGELPQNSAQVAHNALVNSVGVRETPSQIAQKEQDAILARQQQSQSSAGIPYETLMQLQQSFSQPARPAAPPPPPTYKLGEDAWGNPVMRPRAYAEGGMIDMLMGNKKARKAVNKFKNGGAVSGSHEDSIKRILSKK